MIDEYLPLFTIFGGVVYHVTIVAIGHGFWSMVIGCVLRTADPLFETMQTRFLKAYYCMSKESSEHIQKFLCTITI